MSASHSGSDGPNLTPILDMVFQLITFFMLMINFKGTAMDMSLQLPVLGSARPLEYQGQTEPLLLNITSAGQVLAYGQEIDPATFIANEAKIYRTRMGQDLNSKEEIKSPVVLRADQSVAYEKLDAVMRLCQENGFVHFALSAMTRGEEGK